MEPAHSTGGSLLCKRKEPFVSENKIWNWGACIAASVLSFSCAGATEEVQTVTRFQIFIEVSSPQGEPVRDAAVSAPGQLVFLDEGGQGELIGEKSGAEPLPLRVWCPAGLSAQETERRLQLGSQVSAGDVQKFRVRFLCERSESYLGFIFVSEERAFFKFWLNGKPLGEMKDGVFHAGRWVPVGQEHLLEIETDRELAGRARRLITVGKEDQLVAEVLRLVPVKKPVSNQRSQTVPVKPRPYRL